MGSSSSKPSPKSTENVSTSRGPRKIDASSKGNSDAKKMNSTSSKRLPRPPRANPIAKQPVPESSQPFEEKAEQRNKIYIPWEDIVPKNPSQASRDAVKLWMINEMKASNCPCDIKLDEVPRGQPPSYAKSELQQRTRIDETVLIDKHPPYYYTQLAEIRAMNAEEKSGTCDAEV